MQRQNVQLAELTTFRLGGPAEIYSVPETKSELLDEIAWCEAKGEKFRILGKGSNVLVSDNGVAGHVISLARCANALELQEDNVVTAGAGVSLRRFINFCIEHDLYGNEFLSSVPGSIGGAVVMNAGTWTDHNLYISDYLESVDIFDGVTERRLLRGDCHFDYRSSVFHQQPGWVVLGATFCLPAQDRADGEKKRRERLIWSRHHQDLRYGNAGSIFKSGHGRILQLLQGVRIGRTGWSKKTTNWINNYGGGGARSVKTLILLAKALHLAAGIKCELEIRLWDR